MKDWNDGYVTDLGYVHDYYPELNPQRVRFALLQRGLVAPDIRQACELGFGQGISVCMHAAAGRAEWHGNDFNPAQAALARELSAVSGSGASLSDESLADFCRRPDLPDFDFIGMHGVWSWISETNRHVLVDFLRRKLKPGGVVYVSWNVSAGWDSFRPLRSLLQSHKQRAAAGGSVQQIDSAVAMVLRVLNAAPAYLQRNPGVLERLQLVYRQSKGYVAHEFFNRDWQPMDFAEMAGWLQPARLSFATSANEVDMIPDLNHTAEQQQVLAGIQDPVLREAAADLMCSRFFRRDYWVLGARLLGAQARQRALRDQRLLLLTQVSELSLKLEAGVGQVRLPERIFLPVLDLLSKQIPVRLGDLEEQLNSLGISAEQTLEAVTVLLSQGYLALLQATAPTESLRLRCWRLNDHLLQRATDSGEIVCLASPLTGGGVTANRVQQLFLTATRHGMQTPTAYAEAAWQWAGPTLRLRVDGKLLETTDEIRKALLRQAEIFIARDLRLFRTLELLPPMAEQPAASLARP